MKNMLIQSFRAGAFIAFGCILYLLAPNPVIGACLFSIGLLSVRLTQSCLYTGQVHQLIVGNRQWSQMIWIWIANLLGVSFVFFCTTFTDLFYNAKIIGINKLQIPCIELFMRSVCCGVLMTIATQKDTSLWITSGCVIAFVLSGFNHCIADAFYLFASGERIQIWLPTLLIITIGNTLGGLLPVIGIPRK